jgi:hypothetical protein
MTVSRSILVAALPLLGSLLGCAIDRFPTPGKELRSALGYYRQAEEMEASYFRAHGHYGSLDAIFPLASGTGKFRISQGCQGGYCFEVTASNKTYVIRVVPRKVGDQSPERLLSLYGDQTHIIHVAFGKPAADLNSQILSQQQIASYGP